MSGAIDPRDFGRLESEVEGMKELVRAQTVAITTLTTQVNAIQLTLSEARGGWRMLLLVGGAGASLGAGMAWAIQYIGSRGHP
jgi:predicted secreted protein